MRLGLGLELELNPILTKRTLFPVRLGLGLQLELNPILTKRTLFPVRSRIYSDKSFIKLQD